MVLSPSYAAMTQSESGDFWLKQSYFSVDRQDNKSITRLRPNSVSALYGSELSTLISMGLVANPSVMGKLKQAEAAKYGVSGAKWSFFPTPSFTGQQAHAAKNNPNYQGSNKVFQLGLQQPLWSGGRLTNSLTMAEKKLVLSLVELQEMKDQVAYRIINAFGDWACANEKVAAYERAVQSHHQLEGIIRRRIDAGLSPENDYIFAKGRFDQALAELESAKTQRANALINLHQLLGTQVNPTDLMSITRPLLLYAVNADEALSQAMERNPAVLKAKTQIEVQDTQLALTKSSVYPSLSLSFQKQTGNFAYSNLTSSSENLVFLNLTTNFGAGLSNVSQIYGAAAMRESAEADEEMAKKNVTSEVLSTVANLKAAVFRLKALDSACVAAEATEQSWQRQFMAGKKGWQDLLNSTRELSTCRASLADSKESLLLLNWRLAIASMGLDEALSVSGQK